MALTSVWNNVRFATSISARPYSSGDATGDALVDGV